MAENFTELRDGDRALITGTRNRHIYWISLDEDGNPCVDEATCPEGVFELTDRGIGGIHPTGYEALVLLERHTYGLDGDLHFFKFANGNIAAAFVQGQPQPEPLVGQDAIDNARAEDPDEVVHLVAARRPDGTIAATIWETELLDDDEWRNAVAALVGVLGYHITVRDAQVGQLR